MASEIRLSHAVSGAFLEAYRRCDPLLPNGTPEHFMAFPAVVCAAFSAEVGLKNLLSRQGEVAHGHDLRALFLKLLPEQQHAILRATSQAAGLSEQEFATNLAHSRLAFSEWRYIYEARGEKLINVRFLGALASAIDALICEVGAGA